MPGGMGSGGVSEEVQKNPQGATQHDPFIHEEKAESQAKV